MKKAQIYVSGYVQGVGFRAYAKKQAVKLGLFGWVKNLPDRRVEVLVQGDRQKIEELIDLLKKGSSISEVQSISVNWAESDTQYKEFTIIR